MVLDEAVCNEWPGRDIGVFISIGTGKRPDGTNSQEHLWWEGFVSGGIGDFAEARRKLIAKIEGCEKTHKEMKDHLAKRQVNPEHYYRLNVNVGVGEFGMNEWNALSEISTNTRMYLAEKEVQAMSLDAAAKIARIHRAKLRWERAEKNQSQNSLPAATSPPPNKPLPTIPDPIGFAVELPAEELTPDYMATMQQSDLRPAPLQPHRPQHSDNDKYLVVSSDEFPQPVNSINDMPPRHSGEFTSPGRTSDEQFSSERPVSWANSPRVSFEPPPRPPKTPLNDGKVPPPLSGHPAFRVSPISPVTRTSPPPGTGFARPPPGAPLPYPDDDGPPPVVNKASKPEYMR